MEQAGETSPDTGGTNTLSAEAISPSPARGWYSWVQEHRAEVVIAVSTTVVLANIPLQRFSSLFAAKAHWPEAWQGWVRQIVAFFHVPLPQVLLFLAIPVLSLLLLKEPLSKYGFGAGKWKEGLLYAAACVGGLAPFLFWASTMGDFRAYYQGQLKLGFVFLIVQYLLYMLSWEFLFRGYLYFSLEERVGSTMAIWLQSVPFAVAHLGKPAPEALTCYFGGLILGYISLKTRSFLYAFLVHWGIYATLLFFISLGGGKTAALHF
jgi:membrane protease YdiL (CAAX protease family)